jgi:hypothetical protein
VAGRGDSGQTQRIHKEGRRPIGRVRSGARLTDGAQRAPITTPASAETFYIRLFRRPQEAWEHPEARSVNIFTIHQIGGAHVEWRLSLPSRPERVDMRARAQTGLHIKRLGVQTAASFGGRVSLRSDTSCDVRSCLRSGLLLPYCIRHEGPEGFLASSDLLRCSW